MKMVLKGINSIFSYSEPHTQLSSVPRMTGRVRPRGEPAASGAGPGEPGLGHVKRV